MRSTAEAPAITTAKPSPALSRALLLADDHPEPAGVDERHLAQVEHDRLSAVAWGSSGARRSSGRRREVDLAGRDHDGGSVAPVQPDLEQALGGHPGGGLRDHRWPLPVQSTP